MAANLGTLTAVLKADTSGLTKGFKQAQAQTEALSKSLKGSRNALGRFAKGMSQGRDAAGRFGGATKTVGDALKKTAMQADSTTTAITGLVKGFLGMEVIRRTARFFADAVLTNAKFEQSIKDVAIISNATAAEIELLSETASKLGETTQFTANQSAEAMINFARAGFNAAETAKAMAGTLALAAATGGDLSTASNIMVASIKSFGLETGSTARLADIYTAAISGSRFSIESLNAALTVGAPAGAAFNQSVEDTTLVMGLFVDNVGQGEAAATAFRATMAQLAKPTDEAAAVLAKYGLTVEDVNPENQKLSEILKKVGKAGIEGTDALTLFTRRALGPAVSASKRLAEETTNLREELDNQGISTRNAAERMDTLQGSLTLLDSKYEGFAKTLGKILTPAAQLATDALTGLFGTATATLKLDFDTLATSLRGLELSDLSLLLKGAGGLTELFAKLNDNMKAAAATAAAGAGDVKELAGELRATGEAADKAREALGGDGEAAAPSTGTEGLRASLRAAVESAERAKDERQRERRRQRDAPRFGGERKFGESIEAASALASGRLTAKSQEAAKAAAALSDAVLEGAEAMSASMVDGFEKSSDEFMKASEALSEAQEKAGDRLVELTGTATEKAERQFDKALGAWFDMADDARLTADEIGEGVTGLTKEFRAKINKIQERVSAELAAVGTLIGEKVVSGLGAVGGLIDSAIAGFEVGGIKGALAAVVTDLVLQTESFQKLVEVLNKGVSALVIGIDKIIGAFVGLLKNIGGVIAKGFEAVFPKVAEKGLFPKLKEKGGLFPKLRENIKEFFGSADEDAAVMTAVITDVVTHDVEPALGGLAEAANAAASAMSFVPQGVKVALRRFQAIDPRGDVAGPSRRFTLEELAVGGIVRGPTPALIGESGPEAVIPLDRLKEIMGGGGGGVVNNFDFGNSVVASQDQLMLMVAEAMRQAGFVTTGSPVAAGPRFLGGPI